MTLRIGMILDNDFPPDSRVESEALSLINAGYEVFLFSLSYKNRQKVEEINGIKVIRYSSSTLTYKLSALAYSLPLYHVIVKRKIKDFISRYRIQVIHVHDIQIARAVWKANSSDLPCILDLHENRPEIMKAYRHVNTPIGRLTIFPKVWEKFQDMYVRKAYKVVVVTSQAKDVVVKANLKGANDIAVVPNTIHKSVFFQYPVNKEIKQKFSGTFNILYLGDTGLRRGTDTAILAASILKTKIPDLRLIFVGKNNEDVILKKLVDDKNLNDTVVFEGWQDVSLFPSYILAADICISPLKRNKHHDTTFANKIFQYMAMGRPLVVSDCPPQAEIVENEKTGLVHMANDPEDMAEKIFELYQDVQKREKMGKRGEEAVLNQWNWTETSKELLAVYHDLEKRLNSSSDGRH